MKEQKEELIKKTIDTLNEFFIVGSYDYLDRELPHLAAEMKKIEDSIHANMQNDGTIDDLKKHLRDYWHIHVQLMKEFENTKTLSEVSQ